MNKERLKYLNQGFALATADRLRGLSIEESFAAAGLTVKELQESEVDDADLDEIKEEVNKWKLEVEL